MVQRVLSRKSLADVEARASKRIPGAAWLVSSTLSCLVGASLAAAEPIYDACGRYVVAQLNSGWPTSGCVQGYASTTMYTGPVFTCLQMSGPIYSVHEPYEGGLLFRTRYIPCDDPPLPPERSCAIGGEYIALATPAPICDKIHPQRADYDAHKARRVPGPRRRFG